MDTKETILEKYSIEICKRCKNKYNCEEELHKRINNKVKCDRYERNKL